MSGSDKVGTLSERLGIRFREPDRLRHALTHRSKRDGRLGSNERLEFLGDAVVGLAVGAALFRRFPDASEGHLTKIRSGLVSREHLSDVARSVGLGAFLRLGGAEDARGGRENERLLADALEAVFGALYLDGGMEAAGDLAERLIVREAALARFGPQAMGRDSKTELQEWLQARGHRLPKYVIVGNEGPSHRRVFVVEARCRSGSVSARGVAMTKRRAEQVAAGKVLELLIASERPASPTAVARSSG